MALAFYGGLAAGTAAVVYGAISAYGRSLGPTMRNKDSRGYPVALPHSPVKEILPDVFFVKGTATMNALIRFGRNMVVLRHKGVLTLINAVRLNQEGLEELQRHGRIGHVVKIGHFHGADDRFYVETFGAVYWVLPGACDAKSKPKGDTVALFTDQVEYMSPQHLPPVASLSVLVFETTRRPCACLLLGRHGLLLSCDSLMTRTPRADCTFLASFVMNKMGFNAHPVQWGPAWFKFIAKDSQKLIEEFDEIAQLDWHNLISAHGDPLVNGTARKELLATLEKTKNG